MSDSDQIFYTVCVAAIATGYMYLSNCNPVINIPKLFPDKFDIAKSDDEIKEMGKDGYRFNMLLSFAKVFIWIAFIANYLTDIASNKKNQFVTIITALLFADRLLDLVYIWVYHHWLGNITKHGSATFTFLKSGVIAAYFLSLGTYVYVKRNEGYGSTFTNDLPFQLILASFIILTVYYLTSVTSYIYSEDDLIDEIKKEAEELGEKIKHSSLKTIFTEGKLTGEGLTKFETDSLLHSDNNSKTILIKGAIKELSRKGNRSKVKAKNFQLLHIDGEIYALHPDDVNDLLKKKDGSNTYYAKNKHGYSIDGPFLNNHLISLLEIHKNQGFKILTNNLFSNQYGYMVWHYMSPFLIAMFGASFLAWCLVFFQEVDSALMFFMVSIPVPVILSARSSIGLFWSYYSNTQFLVWMIGLIARRIIYPQTERYVFDSTFDTLMNSTNFDNSTLLLSVPIASTSLGISCLGLLALFLSFFIPNSKSYVGVNDKHKAVIIRQ